MSGAGRWMGRGLAMLNTLAGSRLLDSLKLRRATEKAVYRASEAGFRTVAAAGRSFRAAQRLVTPARLPVARGEDFDLTPSDEQAMLRESLQRFAAEALRPAAAQADHDCAAPEALLAEAAALGLPALGVPEALGGAASERSAVTQVLVAEALAHGDMGLALACLAPAAVSTVLAAWGDADQQSTYLPAFTGEQPAVAALAILEPGVLFDPLELQATARRADGGFVLDGVKALVPRAQSCELFVVAARLDGTPALFLVESSAAGLGIEAEPAMGLRAASLARLSLQAVKLPATALLGGGDPAVYRECLQRARLGWCALAVGTAQAVLDYVIPYVNERSAFGEPIAHRQSVAFAVADIAIELEGMRLATWRAAGRADEGLPFAREAALARRLCADHGMQIGSAGVQLLGGHGFVKEHPVERWYRDLRAVGLMEGALLA